MLEEKIVQWENEILQKGIAQGLAQGRREGRSEGISQGRVMAYQEIILDNLGSRFGEIKDGLRQAILKIADPDILFRLAGASLKACSAEEFERALAAKDTLQ